MNDTPDARSKLVPAQLSLCAGGLVTTWTDRPRLWSLDDDGLRRAMYEGLLARTQRADGRFREVALLDEERGVLVLAPRTRAPDADPRGAFDGVTIPLGTPGKPRDTTMDDVADGLRRAVRFTVASGGYLLLEAGGWDAPAEPYCLFVAADDEIRLEAAPAPAGSQFWSDHVTAGQPVASVAAPRSDATLAVVWRMMWDVALTWDVTPWDLALTYGVRPPSA
ncbi:hypothetical protein [Xylanimonas protaetiae]|uniref:Uncharacterized protein n=1 Tax=Xylanimonas protaetiae TaxID=2509457 RepID=A0A4P6F6I2_9MICO|nr:hypothetical protein [Xylanimonas protaetiae]QAY71590.1 hypothetical protein ET471_17420 [Xylanimonas protaetiae]